MPRVPHRRFFCCRSVAIVGLMVCLLQSLANCQVTSSADEHVCATQLPPADTSQSLRWCPWLVAAAVAAACFIMSASYQTKLDAAVNSFLGPTDQHHDDFHERIAPAVRLAGLCILPLNAAYHFYVTKTYEVTPIVLFLILLMTPASLSKLKLLLKSDVLRSDTLPCGTATILIPRFSPLSAGADPSKHIHSNFWRNAARLSG